MPAMTGQFFVSESLTVTLVALLPLRI